MTPRPAVPRQHDLEALAADAGQALRRGGLRLATAESCTGGWVGQAITAIAGSSDWYDQGFITYSNDAKIAQLGVAPDTLARDGAVSEATAREMARGALARSTADWAVAITGIAGPGGGSADKPVGMVCFAWAARSAQPAPDQPLAETRHFTGDRAAVRAQAVHHALAGLLVRLGQR